MLYKCPTKNYLKNKTDAATRLSALSTTTKTKNYSTCLLDVIVYESRRLKKMIIIILARTF